MDPNSYCMVLLAQMRNGKLQVASNYPEVGSSFVTSELALRFSNCTAELDVFKTNVSSKFIFSCKYLSKFIKL